MNRENKTPNLGWKLVNFCEFDKYAERSYCAIHNVDESLNLGDITKVDENKLESFNMICGGSPCQDFSVAGKQKGSVWTCKDCKHEYNPLTVHWNERDRCPNCSSNNIEKTRSSLLVEYLRVVRTNKPNFGIYENVKNIVGKQFKDTTFKLFTDELKEYGYNVYWEVLNSKNYGIPQNRERVYLIFIKKEVDNGKFKFPEPFDNGLRLKDLLEDEVDEKFYVDREKVEQFIINNPSINFNKPVLGTCHKRNDLSFATRDRVYNNKIESPTLTATMFKDPPKVLQVGNIVKTGNWDNPQRGRIYSKEGCCPSLNCCTGGGLEPKIIQIGNINPSNKGMNGNVYSEQGISPTLTTNKGEGNKVAIKQATKQGYVECEVGGVADLSYPNSKTRRGRVQDGGRVCPTITATETGICKIEQQEEVSDNTSLTISDIRIRKLTPKECFRLMGFSDKSFNAAQKEGISNSQLYKQAGNSIVVDVLYYILIQLYKAMPYLFNDLRLGSFFSGIGAFEIALDRLYESINSGNLKV